MKCQGIQSKHLYLKSSMDTIELAKTHQYTRVVEEEELSQECKELLLTLKKEKGWHTSSLYQYQGLWCSPHIIQSLISFQIHFQSQDTDIIVSTLPRSGTIWLKALTFAVVNRKRFQVLSPNHPLLTSCPHSLVPFLEYQLYGNNQIPDLSSHTFPRLFSTHLSFSSLAESIKSSNARIVYLCRNPLDNVISLWSLVKKMRSDALTPLGLEEAFDMYCKGVTPHGPFWDHVLEYWKLSLERPQKVLFLKYEDMKEDISFHLKRLAEFLGLPFSIEEEREGVVEEIVRLCGFQKMKETELNRIPEEATGDNTKLRLLRKGEVGEWVNHLTPSMAERLSAVTEEKFAGSGLKFKNFR